jgi:hypothetical protein
VGYFASSLWKTKVAHYQIAPTLASEFRQPPLFSSWSQLGEFCERFIEPDRIPCPRRNSQSTPATPPALEAVLARTTQRLADSSLTGAPETNPGPNRSAARSGAHYRYARHPQNRRFHPSTGPSSPNFQRTFMGFFEELEKRFGVRVEVFLDLHDIEVTLDHIIQFLPIS